MSFSIRPFCGFPVHGSVIDNAEPFQCQGTIWNLSCTAGVSQETLSLTATLPNEQRLLIPEAVVRWSRGQE